MTGSKSLLIASLFFATQAAQAQSLPAPHFATPNTADNSSQAATTAWVRAQNYASTVGSAASLTAAQVATALGFTPQRASVFNVLDYGAVADGVTDLGPALRSIAAQLGNSGTPNVIVVPAGHYVLSSAVVFSSGAPILLGQGFVAGPSPAAGTWITISATGFVPFTFSGSSARGGVVRDIAITQTQPALATGWAPTGYDYVFKILNALGEVTFDNVLFAGVTRGIYADNSGRLLVKNVVGQFYTAGIEIDDCYDIPRIEYLHAWTYSTSSPFVLAWQQANLNTVILRRVDGIFIGDLFTYAARDALYLTTGANGVTTKLYANSIYADQSKYGVLVDGVGINGQFGKVTTQHNDVAAGGGAIQVGSRGMLITGSSDQFQVAQWRTNSVNGPAIDLEGSNNRVSVDDLWANTYYVSAPGDGTPAIMVADTSISGNPANFAEVRGTPFLQGVSPRALFNASTNGGRSRTLQMNSVDGGSPGNELRGYDNTAGNPVSLAAIGSDSSVDLQLQAKSITGSVKLQANGQTVVRVDDANSGLDDVLFRAGSGTLNLIAEGGDPNIDYYVTPKGTTGGVRLQANGLTTLREDNVNSGDSDVLVRPGIGALNLITESASASADLILAAKGPTGGIRFQAQGATVFRTDNPGTPGTSDLLIRTGAATMALTVEDPGANANLVLNAKGAGTVALGSAPPLSDNSSNVVTSAWVKSQSYLSAAPVTSVAGRGGAVTLSVTDVAGAAPLTAPAFTVGQSTSGTPPGGAGFARTGTYLLEAATATTAATRLTSDGNVPSATNCVNLPASSAYSAFIDITGIDRSTGASAARYRLLDALLLRGAALASTQLINGVTAAAPNGSVGSGGTASFTAAADTTNGCLALSVTAPNADAWHWSARVLTNEVQ